MFVHKVYNVIMSKPVTIRLNDDTLAAVEALAEDEKRTVSYIVGELVRDGLTRRTLPVTINTVQEAVNVPKVMKQARASEECAHGKDPKFCAQCQVSAKKYGAKS